MRYAFLASILVLVALLAAIQPSAPARESDAAFPGANGKVVFTRLLGPDIGWGEIFVMDADGGNEIQLSNSLGFDWGPTWSADGSKIAFTRDDDIWIMDADGGNQTNLTPESIFNDRQPSWSPFGDKIVFFSGGFIKIVSIADLTVTDLGVSGQDPAWSPDGGRIAYLSYDPVVALRVMNADGSNSVSIAPIIPSVWSPDWSPDGKSIVMSGIGSLRIVDECGGNEHSPATPPDSHGMDARWSPDGHNFVMTRGEGIMITDVDGSNPQVITTDVYTGGLDWQPVNDSTPEPQPRPHNCVDIYPATPAPTPSPLPSTATPQPTPIELPRSGGADHRDSRVPAAVGITIATLTATAGVLALRRIRR